MDRLDEKRKELIEIIKEKRILFLAEILMNDERYPLMNEKEKELFEKQQMDIIDDKITRYIEVLAKEQENANLKRQI